MKLSCCILFLFSITVVHGISDWKWMETLPKDINQYLDSGIKSDNLVTAFDLLHFRTPFKLGYKPLDIKLFDDVLSQGERESVKCDTCRSLVDTALSWVESGDSREQIVEKWVTLCLDLQTSTPRVCRGSIEMTVDMALWVLAARNESGRPLTSAQICGFTSYPDCVLDEDQFSWTLDLEFLGPKPEYETPELPPVGSPTMKVLQITDIHIDPNYEPGSNAECGEPNCCRQDQGLPSNVSVGAGYWGDYRDCDTPIHAFQDLLRDAANRHTGVSYVIFTGDIIDHANWATSQQYNSDLNTFAISEIAKYFPDIPILPILGNHEAIPSNVFSDPLKLEIPESLSTTWLYDLSVDLWMPWLPPSTSSSIKKGGMYTIDITPELRIISINSMGCLSYNWWLMYDNVDPYEQLIWLSNQLLQAEMNNKKVHILSHIPPGFKDCMHFWSSQYRRIIDRFENTVVAQFHGHTHRDHFSLYYDLTDVNRATNVGFTGGGATTFSNVNPNYRVYSIDGGHLEASYRVLDHETWFYNLTDANLVGSEGTPKWQKLYSFNEAYSTKSMLPIELDQLVLRMASNTTLQQQYFEFYVKRGDAALENGCDVTCLQNYVCNIVTTVVNDKTKCHQLFPPKD